MSLAVASVCAGAGALAGLGPAGVPEARAGADGAETEPDADLERARAHFEAGRSLFEAGRYRDALAEFARADALVPSPLNRYNIALCHERLGNREAAAAEYEAYLEGAPEAGDRGEIEARISALRSDPKEPGGADKEREPARDRSGDETARRGDDRDVDAGGDPEPERRSAPIESDSPREPPKQEVEALAERRQSGPQGGDGDGRADRAEGGGDGAGAEEEQREAPRVDPGDARGPPGGRPRGREPAPARPEGDDDGGTPFYQNWWFWGVAGVSALILLDIATTSPGGDRAGAEMTAPESGGAAIWRF